MGRATTGYREPVGYQSSGVAQDSKLLAELESANYGEGANYRLILKLTNRPELTSHMANRRPNYATKMQQKLHRK